MDVTLVFDKPLFVSPARERDQLSVTFKSSYIFVDEDNLTFEKDITLLKSVPTQFANAKEKIALEKTRKILDNGT